MQVIRAAVAVGTSMAVAAGAPAAVAAVVAPGAAEAPAADAGAAGVKVAAPVVRDGFAGRAGDFDGDGKDDIAAFTRGRGGDVYVGRSTGTRFDGIGDLWTSGFALWSQTPLVGDFDGDGRSDVAAFARGNKPTVSVALSTGRSFGPTTTWATSFAPDVDVPAVGDVNGDGKDDVVAFRRGQSATVTVGLSTGRSFRTAPGWHGGFAPHGWIPAVADVDGDRRADLVAFSRGHWADVWVARSTGRVFGRAAPWTGWFAGADSLPGLGDVNGDGRADAVAFARGTSAEVTVALSTGRSFRRAAAPWSRSWTAGGAVPGLGDFNGDGRDDVVAFTRGGRADVDVARSTGRSFQEPAARWHQYFAAATEIPQPGILW